MFFEVHAQVLDFAGFDKHLYAIGMPFHFINILRKNLQNSDYWLRECHFLVDIFPNGRIIIF